MMQKPGGGTTRLYNSRRLMPPTLLFAHATSQALLHRTQSTHSKHGRLARCSRLADNLRERL